MRHCGGAGDVDVRAHCQQRNANFPVPSALVFMGPGAMLAESCSPALQQPLSSGGNTRLQADIAQTELFSKSRTAEMAKVHTFCTFVEAKYKM